MGRKGKLNKSELIDMLSIIKNENPDTLVGPNIGLDSAMIKANGNFLISSDPITADCSNKGYLSVCVNANDIFAAGGVPKFCTVTIIAPTKAIYKEIKDIMLEISSQCRHLNIDILGGHTEFSSSVKTIIVSITMIGEAKNINVVKNQASEGDLLIMTKSLGIESTIILCDKYNIESPFLIQDLSIEKESEIIRNSKYVTSMHDITEGGIYGASVEIASANNKGVILYEEKIPIHPVTKDVCQKASINIMKSISSGSLLFTVKKGYENEVNKKLKENGIEVSIIGEITSKGKFSIQNRTKKEIKIEEDEIFKVV